MASGLFRLNFRDLSKGLVLAVISAVVAYFTSPESLNSPDWNYILKIALIAGFSYISKNFISDSDGRVLGRIG